jgi:hypothetical protein
VCGGHGSYRVIGHLIDEALDEHTDLLDRRTGPRDRRGDIEQEVKVMYARGDINANTYYRLLDMAQNGQLSWDDLARVRQGARVEELVTEPAPREMSKSSTASTSFTRTAPGSTRHARKVSLYCRA